MRIRIGQIPEQGDAVVLSKSERWAVDAASQALEGEVLALSGTLELELHGDTLFVRGEMKVRGRRHCDRCGAFLILEIEGPVDLAYRPEIQSSEAVRELSNAEMDVGFYTGGSFELADAVCEHLALKLPFQVHCAMSAVSPGKECEDIFSEDSKEEQVDPRFAILKELKFDN